MNGTKARKQFKLPRSVLAKSRVFEMEEETTTNPTTAEEFLDQGVQFEESGDRWFTSDLSKAIRFYHRAHNSYKEALKLNPILSDALYNLPRLEYEVYDKYTKDESVILDDLTNCADAINDNKQGGLFQNIYSLCKSFETSMEILIESGNDSLIGWDFNFNTGMCYYEYIEVLCSEPTNIINLNSESELVSLIKRCMKLFNSVLNSIENIIRNNKNTVEDEKNDKLSILNVCIECYKMISTVYETLYNDELLNNMDLITSSFVEKIDYFVNEIINNNINNEIPIDLINSLKIFKLNQIASRQLNYNNFFKIWNSQEIELNNNLEKQLVESSSIRSFIDKFETIDLQLPVELKWQILSDLNNKYKIITETLKQQIKEIETLQNLENDLLTKKISLLCSVFIERADIELERSFLEISEAISNRQILQNNCKNLLKNCLIYSKKSGGLKESSSGKLMRKKRQREAAMRLCLLEGKSQDDWNLIIGDKYWPLELKSISEIDAYKKFFS